MGGWYPQNCKGASLSVLGYHWLPLATIDIVGDNSEFDIKGIFLSCDTYYGVVDILRTVKVHHSMSLVTIGCP